MSNVVKLTQDQRSAITTEKLQDATIDLIAEVGYSNTTTVNIAKRAGVTRGALMHHYKDKTDLVIDATRQMWASSIAATHEICAQLNSGHLDLDGFVDLLWERSFAEKYVTVTVDMIIAARTDERISLHLDTSVQKLFAAYNQIANSLFSGTDLTAEQREIAMTMIAAMVRGLRIQNMMSHQPEQIDTARKALKLFLKSGRGLGSILSATNRSNDATKT